MGDDSDDACLHISVISELFSRDLGYISDVAL